MARIVGGKTILIRKQYVSDKLLYQLRFTNGKFAKDVKDWELNC